MKNKLPYIFLLLLLAVWLPDVTAQEKILARIKVRNTTSGIRGNELVEVKFSNLQRKVGTAPFKLVEKGGVKEIPYQLEYRGHSTPLNLLIGVGSLGPGETLSIDIVPGQPAAPAAKTFARYVPERKDDFAWENDLVAFRMYGKALETASDNATGTDIWSKKTDKLILNKWYKENTYHIDKGEGMDYYHVGITLGAGDIAPFYRDSIIFSKNYHRFKILDNGPLRSTFELGYDPWQVGDMVVSATKTISLDAGSQLNRVEVNYNLQGAPQMEVVAGISKRKQESPVLLNQENGIIGYWEPEVKDKGIMGVGILTNPPVQLITAKGHLLSKMTVKNNIPLVYYNGGAWNKAGKITSAEEWFAYLQNFKSRINKPLKVSVK